MDDHHMQIVNGVSYQLENGVNKILQELMDTHDMDTSMEMAMEILVNVSSSLLAKAVLICEPTKRDKFYDMVLVNVQDKVQEGVAMVQSHIAIDRAMTCSPKND